MSSLRTSSTRQRLLNAALELFVSQGVTETTTRQIAERAEVNEVTLFRHFGNKHGLLLAVIEESEVFAQVGRSLAQHIAQTDNIHQTLKEYAHDQLQAVEQIPALIRSVVGESGQYPTENRQALGRGFIQANHYIAQYLEAAVQQGKLEAYLPPAKIASLLNSTLLGYAVIKFTSDFDELWDDQNDFLESLATLFMRGAIAPTSSVEITSSEEVKDLPAAMVHTMLQRAKKMGPRDYALFYLLFGAGLKAKEIVTLERSHQICDNDQHLLQLNQRTGAKRQVPLNQRILGKRYGSYNNNPLTQWLKSRKDDQPAMFINDAQQPLSEEDIRLSWQGCTTGLLTPEGQPPKLEQAHQTWCLEMLMRGMTLEDLSILTHEALSELQPYTQRARAKVALEQAIKLDR
ncbi:MAG: TetR family transcriptional regulator [Gloeobacterales cyanobacterium]